MAAWCIACSGSWRHGTSQAAVTGQGGSRPGCCQCRQRDSVGDRPGRTSRTRRSKGLRGAQLATIQITFRVRVKLGSSNDHCTGPASDPSQQLEAASRVAPSHVSSLTSSSFRPHATLGGLRLGVCTRRRPDSEPRSSHAAAGPGLFTGKFPTRSPPAGRRPGVGPLAFATST